jgi:hypothetical protein
VATCFVCGDGVYDSPSAVSPDGSIRHVECPVRCIVCLRATVVPVYRPGQEGAYCSEACVARSSGSQPRCTVCKDLVGREPWVALLCVMDSYLNDPLSGCAGPSGFSIAPNGTRRHTSCALPCDSCGQFTTSPAYFRHVPGTLASVFHAASALCAGHLRVVQERTVAEHVLMATTPCKTCAVCVVMPSAMRCT